MKCVVVGAGSAGCVAARRLHDAGHEVVLVECGPSLEPGRVPPTIDGADSFAALAEPGRRHPDVVSHRVTGATATPYARGRGVGGSSAVNSMLAVRGDDALYRSWGWDDADAAFDRILVPSTPVDEHELGVVDRLLLDAEPRARIAELTRRAGRRVTSAEAYVWPILASVRFGLVVDRRVDRIVFDSTGAAVGVDLDDSTTVDADMVVLAAGAIHSPAILLRSGVDDVGVGEGLMDHPAVGFVLEIADDIPTGAPGTPYAPRLAVGSYADLDPIQLLPLNHLGHESSLAMLLVALMRPVGAHGSVSLVTHDPSVEPLVEMRLLEDPDDVEQLRAGVRHALGLLESAPFADAVERVLVDGVGTPVDRLGDDESIDRWMRASGADYVHATSSCARALDPDGRVRGRERLVVWDASAFPSIPDANPHWPTMMLAERLSARWVDMEGSAS